MAEMKISELKTAHLRPSNFSDFVYYKQQSMSSCVMETVAALSDFTTWGPQLKYL